MIPSRYLKRLFARLIAAAIFFSLVIFVFNSVIDEGNGSKSDLQINNIDKKIVRDLNKDSKLSGNINKNQDIKDKTAHESQSLNGAIDADHKQSNHGKNENNEDQKEHIEDVKRVRQEESKAEHGVEDEGKGDEGKEDEGQKKTTDRRPKDTNLEEAKAEKDGRAQIEPPKDKNQQPHPDGPGKFIPLFSFVYKFICHLDTI
jgi:hypothetical protein